VSSVKVNGEQTTETQPFVESDEPNPHDPYAISKWRAETRLAAHAQETGLEVVIGVHHWFIARCERNFIKPAGRIERGIPLPLAGANNVRSLVMWGTGGCFG